MMLTKKQKHQPLVKSKKRKIVDRSKKIHHRIFLVRKYFSSATGEDDESSIVDDIQQNENDEIQKDNSSDSSSCCNKLYIDENSSQCQCPVESEHYLNRILELLTNTLLNDNLDYKKNATLSSTITLNDDPHLISSSNTHSNSNDKQPSIKSSITSSKSTNDKLPSTTQPISSLGNIEISGFTSTLKLNDITSPALKSLYLEARSSKDLL
ncbi:unnamed protein product [Rotaria socialis]|uniref:Uncharacterized protein n=1 Tax=Rotaria socialis TaxID=392032 RepID=A0A821VLF5_9BILA|nr:unnamed protein product [Rotaria socialis]CAF4908085.1 unnamed protein product [Rotaria socialis]